MLIINWLKLDTKSVKNWSKIGPNFGQKLIEIGHKIDQKLIKNWTKFGSKVD